jgi:hypothetical protein
MLRTELDQLDARCAAMRRRLCACAHRRWIAPLVPAAHAGRALAVRHPIAAAALAALAGALAVRALPAGVARRAWGVVRRRAGALALAALTEVVASRD